AQSEVRVAPLAVREQVPLVLEDGALLPDFLADPLPRRSGEPGKLATRQRKQPAKEFISLEALHDPAKADIEDEVWLWIEYVADRRCGLRKFVQASEHPLREIQQAAVVDLLDPALLYGGQVHRPRLVEGEQFGDVRRRCEQRRVLRELEGCDRIRR